MKMKVGTPFTGVRAVNLLVSNLLPQCITVDGFDLVYQAILTAGVGADMLIYIVFMEFPAKC
jgi:hypothetical protein